MNRPRNRDSAIRHPIGAMVVKPTLSCLPSGASPARMDTRFLTNPAATMDSVTMTIVATHTYPSTAADSSENSPTNMANGGTPMIASTPAVRANDENGAAFGKPCMSAIVLVP